jgi:hypothetical protein
VSTREDGCTDGDPPARYLRPRERAAKRGAAPRITRRVLEVLEGCFNEVDAGGWENDTRASEADVERARDWLARARSYVNGEK